jgi:hypothetical protein
MSFTNIGDGVSLQLLNGVLSKQVAGVTSELATNITECFTEPDGSFLYALTARGEVINGYGPEFVITSDLGTFYSHTEASRDPSRIHIPAEGGLIHKSVYAMESILNMSGNSIVGGIPATNVDGFVILSQLQDASQGLRNEFAIADEVNASAIAALTNVVNNLDLSHGLSEAQVVAIANARVAAGLLTQFDNDTMNSLLTQLRSQLSAVDGAIANDVVAVQALYNSLEARVTALEVQNADQSAQLTAHSTRMGAIEGVNTAQSTQISTLQAGLAVEAQTNASQYSTLNNQAQSIAALAALAAPIVVELRDGVIVAASGVAISAVSVSMGDPSSRHMMVTIDTNGRKHCDSTFLRVVNEVGHTALCESYVVGPNKDKYVFVCLKKVGQGMSTADATFRLSGGSFA